MTLWNLTQKTAFVVLMSSTASFADVTPEDVWQNWQDSAKSSGQTITSDSAERDGDALVVTALTSSMDQDGGKYSVTIDEVTFTDMGDGTVEVTMSDSFPVSVTIPAKTDDPTSTPTNLTLDVTLPGLSTVVSGTPEQMSYETDAPAVTVKLDAIEGVDAAQMDVKAEASIVEMTAKYLVEGAESGKNITSDFTATSVNLTVNGTDSATSDTFDLTAAIADLTGHSTGAMPGGEMPAQLSDALNAGLAANGTFGFGATTFDLNAVSGGKPTKVAGSAESSSTDFAMDAKALSYTSTSKAVGLTVTSPDIPIPDLTVNYGEAAFSLLMPVSKADAPADFSFLTKIIDLKVSDAIWSMIDPTAALPHDPATLIIDTKGTATVTSDLMTSTEMQAMGGVPPAQLNSFDLTQLQVKLAGAELTGVGGFTFDNADTTTYGGMPAPTGKVDLKLVGGNALIDKLVAMGVVPQDQAMQGRMMLSMFANPGADGADEMTSALEFKGGGFYANGQQLQ